jgi:integrase
MRSYEKLTARRVSVNNQPGMHSDGGGLYLRIDKSGSKSWIYRYRVGQRQHDLGLGSTRVISLADARRKAVEITRQRLDGNDPLLERRALRHAEAVERAKTITFRQAAEQYIDAQAAGWRGGSNAQQWTASLTTYAHPVIGLLPVAAIDLGLVLRVLEPIWTTKPETATRVRRRVEAVLGWATTHGYRNGDNPARWSGHLENILAPRVRLAAVRHHAALPYGEMGAFMTALRQNETVPARALEFAIMTAARAGEVFGATWNEIDTKARIWTVPAARMKGAREHTVPLSDAAMACLGKPGAGYLFPSPRGGRPLNKTVFHHLKRTVAWAGSDYTAHGFRSTFRDWCGDCTAYPREVVETALAHTVGNAVEQAYRRGSAIDTRRRLMEQWGRFCEQPAAAGKVVAIGR